MSSAKSPRLDLIVGPNGAGKSSLVRLVLSKLNSTAFFVNADEIAKRISPDDPSGSSYEAARIAEQQRALLIEIRRSFMAETVFSHPSKVELIRRAQREGFYVALHVVMVPEEVSVARVAARVLTGGHSVPEHKIRTRYHRVWPNVAEAISMADESHVFDNSHQMTEIAEFYSGHAAWPPLWPDWTPESMARVTKSR